MVVSALLAAVQASRLVMNGAIEKQKYDEETDTPKREVSHFTQDKVKKWMDKGVYGGAGRRCRFGALMSSDVMSNLIGSMWTALM